MEPKYKTKNPSFKRIILMQVNFSILLFYKKKSASKDKGYTHAPQNRNQKHAIYQDGKM